MSEQNIFDNKEFFDGYRKLRENEINFNGLLEQPAIGTLLPKLFGKEVLDLGCGYGHNSIDFVKRGAKSVVGVDISERMLEVAKKENGNEKINYINMSMTEIEKLDCSFDFIYSSLAFHYVEDFNAFAKSLFAKLKSGGELLFSQEHPFVTATHGGAHYYNKGEDGRLVSFTFSDYGDAGKRECFWFVDGVEKYHRRFSDIVNALCEAGFIIERVCEPMPSAEAIKQKPSLGEKEYIKPTFLIVKAKRQ